MPLLTNNTIGKQQIINIKKGVSNKDTPFLITFIHKGISSQIFLYSSLSRLFCYIFGLSFHINTSLKTTFTPTKYENYMKRTLCTMKTKLIAGGWQAHLQPEHKCISALKKKYPTLYLTHWHKLRLWMEQLEQIRMQCERTAHQRNGGRHDCHRHEGCRL